MRRLVWLGVGIVLVLAGLVLCVIPGPGLPLIFVGGAFLAAESLAAARILDWLEVKVTVVWNWLKKRWDPLPLWAKIPVALVVAAGGIAGSWLFWQLMH